MPYDDQMTYRAIHANVHKPGSAAKNRRTVQQAWENADVLCLNEANDSAVINAVRTLSGGARWWFPSGNVGNQNPIIWRNGTFELVDKGWKVVYAGGRGDGPSRTVTIVVLRERSTGKLVIIANLHEIAKAFTDNRDRQPEWRQILSGAARYIAAFMAKYPGVPVQISGDMNAPGLIDFPGIAERELPSPATYGRRRYDRFFTVGDIRASKVHALNTPSDHHALVASFDLGGSTQTPRPDPNPLPQAKPQPPKEDPVAKNDVTEAREEFAKMFAHWRLANAHLRQAKRGRRVVGLVERTMTATYHVAARAFKTLPRS